MPIPTSYPQIISLSLADLKYDTWGCERQPAALPVIQLDSPTMQVMLTPQFGGKVWGMQDKVAKRDFFFNNPAHQPANIGARGAWTAGGLEFNWSPGYLGHSAFTEERVWAARLATERGDMVRIWEFDRYNGTVFQVDVLLDGDELWTHTKVTNPHNGSTLGYWWTCAAHTASPGTRILAPAAEVTVETYVGAPLRNAPWPYFDNGMLNSTFSGIGGGGGGGGGKRRKSGGGGGGGGAPPSSRLADSSYLGNIAYTGDYFLRVPNASRNWIAHVDDSGEYVAVHGHTMAGTKFFTWGQSGPGRFMQDFLAGGVHGGGYYTELQSGLKPTQQQVFTLAGRSHVAFTAVFKPMRLASGHVAADGSGDGGGGIGRGGGGGIGDGGDGGGGDGGGDGGGTGPAGGTGPLPDGYEDATQTVGRWWDSAAGVPQAKARAMEAFFASHEDRTPKPSELLSRGSPWGALHQRLNGGAPLAPGVLFEAAAPGTPEAAESALWQELAETGSFSPKTLQATRAPLAYAVDGLWVGALEKSAAAHGTSWLHGLLLATAYAERGEVDRPRKLLLAAQADATGSKSPIVARNLAVLSETPDAAYPLFLLAWNLTVAVAGVVHGVPSARAVPPLSPLLSPPPPPPPPRNSPPEVASRLAQNVADELLTFLIGNVPGATEGTADTGGVWFGRLRRMADEAEHTVGAKGSDTILMARLILQVNEGGFDAAMATLASECFPTLGRGRDALIALWHAAATGREAAKLRRPLTPVEAHRARKAAPIPKNVGCPYATLYCENYW